MRVLCLRFISLVVTTIFLMASVAAETIRLEFTGAPQVVAGTAQDTGAVGTKSYWSNVGKLGDVSIDMEVELLSNSVATPNSVLWYADSGSAKLDLVGEGPQRVDVVYRFFVSGTETPIVVSPEVIFSDLDGGLRAEVISTLADQVASFTLDAESAIQAELIPQTDNPAIERLEFTSASGKNLAANSSFELGNTGFSSSYLYLGEHSSGTTSVADWGEDRYGIFSDDRTGDSANSYFNQTLANTGNAFIIIDIGSDLINPFWEMTLNLEQGKPYVFSAFLANINDSNTTIKPNVNFVLNSSSGSQVLAESGDLNTGGSSVTPWQEFTSEFVASGEGSTLQMVANSAGLIGNDLAMDDVVVREVLPTHEVALQITLQPAAEFYFTFEKSAGLGEFTFDCSLPDVFETPESTNLDTEAPAAPTVNGPIVTLDTTPIISGTAEPYIDVFVEVADATFSAPVDGMGFWHIDTETTPNSGVFSPATDGTANSLSAWCTDQAGNQSDTTISELVIEQVSSEHSELTVTPEQLYADGASQASLTLTTRNEAGEVIPWGGAIVEFTASIGSVSGVDDLGDGHYVALLTSSLEIGTATITATVNNAVTLSVEVDFVAAKIHMDPISGDNIIDESETGLDLLVTGSSRFIPDGTIVTITLLNGEFTGSVEDGQWEISVPAAWVERLGVSTEIQASLYDAVRNDVLTVVSTVQSVDSPPTFHLPQSFDVEEDSAPQAILTESLLSDPEGGPLEVEFSAPSGTVEFPQALLETLVVSETESEGAALYILRGSLRELNELFLTMTYAPIANHSGDAADALRWSCKDEAGNQVEGSLLINITSVNDAPLISGEPTTEIAAGSLYSFQPVATDADGDVLTFSIEALPSWASFDPANGSISGTPDRKDAGDYVGITISVSDGSVSAELEPFAIQVSADNASPVFVNGEPPQIPFDAVSAPLEDIFIIEDADNDTQTVRIWVESGDVAGKESASITLSETELHGASLDVQFDESVLILSGDLEEINQALKHLVFFSGDSIVTESDIIILHASTEDGFGGAASTQVPITLLPSSVPSIVIPSTVNLEEDAEGTLIEGIEISDGNQSEQTVSIVATGGHVDIDLAGLTDLSDSVDTPSIHFSGSLADVNHALSELLFTPADNVFGDASASISITSEDVDGQGAGECVINLEPVNDSPILTLPESFSVLLGSTDVPLPESIRVEDIDSESVSITFEPQGVNVHIAWPEETSALLIEAESSYSFTGSVSELNAALDTIRISPSLSEPGTANIGITLDDQNVQVTETLVIEVLLGNVAPTISGTPLTETLTGVEYTFAPNATDGNGDSLAFVVTGLPAWARMDEQTGQIAGIPSIDDVGETEEIIIAVSDGSLTSELVPFTITVLLDTDADGVADLRDTDDDGDGIPDAVEGTEDPDGDGVGNDLDTDSDGDGLPDAEEGVGDLDGDGIADYLDDSIDEDADGIPDIVEGIEDADQDGTPNAFDTDSDGDGIDDSVEAVGYPADTDSDGVLDPFDVDQTGGEDLNGDGIDDQAQPQDTDLDGIPDYLDSDSDGDTIPDAVEGEIDTNLDGEDDYRDLDSDGDGLPDASEAGSAHLDSDGDGIDDLFDVDQTGGLDANLDGVDDDVAPLDSDLDQLPDYRDIDSDDDGIPDDEELGSTGLDDDQDGIDDAFDPDTTGGADANQNGIDDEREPLDSDGDGAPNYIDQDSDGDGRTDAEEGTGDQDADGIPNYLDSDDSSGSKNELVDRDGDGIPDVLEGTIDSDGDGISNDLDPDSDNDGIPDHLEGAASGWDTDGDGIDDRYDTDQSAWSDLDNDGIAESALPDHDADGLPDFLDPDSDGDGIPDALEVGLTGLDQDGDGIDNLFDTNVQPFNPDSNLNGLVDSPDYRDTDNDGTPDYLDLDSDNDGVGDGLDDRTPSLDSDGDGITDRYDVDVTGGEDLNADGIDDAVSLSDTDGDGSANVWDLDSDNDGLLDVIEADLEDTDGDGFADLGENIATVLPNSDDDADEDIFDPDQDNDGVGDIEETSAQLLDADGDGVIDITEDSDGDGLDDAFDADDLNRGHILDSDGDGVANHLDIDDDNDGIPDSVEGDLDSDGDGIVNRIDRDSDGDGLSDWFESDGLPLWRTDEDGDGLDDAFDVPGGWSDSDNDGIPDYADASGQSEQDTNDDGVVDWSSYGPVIDTDGDGTPDRLDLDSDADGLTDGVENVLLPLIQQDIDRDGLDDAIDFDFAGQDDLDGDNTTDQMIDYRDIDQDGLLAFRDPDSDGDGISDFDENHDANKDGVIDSQQKETQQQPKKIRTAVRGAGALDTLFWLPLLFIFLLGRKKQGVKMQMIRIFSICGLLCLPIWGNAQGTEEVTKRSWYGGLGLGVSELLPKENGSDWDVREHSDTAYKIFLGYQYSNRLFFELDFNHLGETAVIPLVQGVGEAQTISYRVPTISGGYYLFPAGSKLNVFGRIGLGRIINKASKDNSIYEQNSDAQLIFGAGAEWQMTKRLFARAEATSFDKDAKAFMLSLAYQLGHKSEQVVSTDSEPLVTLAAISSLDNDQDGVPNDQDQCPRTEPGRMVDEVGCDLDRDKDGQLDRDVVEVELKVLFDTDSSYVKPQYYEEIFALARFLKDYSDTSVVIEGHTDDVGTESYNQVLSDARATSVATILKQQLGAEAHRVRIYGYGETRPLIAKKTVEARRQNRRVIARISK